MKGIQLGHMGLFAMILIISNAAASNDHHLKLEQQDSEEPEQLHLSLGANDSEYYVTWSSMKPAQHCLIWCKHPCPGLDGARAAEGLRSDRTVSAADGRKREKHSYRAKMIVEPDTTYDYLVAGCGGKSSHKASKTYTFKALPFDDAQRKLRLIFYGDLGLKNAQSVPRLTKELELNDLIIHNGDFAYDLDTEHGRYGDAFMRLMEPIAARIPYQTSVGNHEIKNNFSEYNHRFTMFNRGPIKRGEQNNFFYSFNAGPVHFVAFSTEFYYFLDYVGLSPLVRQYNWLIEDLKQASSPEQRRLRPWIVVFGHRPMYCSSRDRDDCSKDSNLLRRGLPFTGAFALEKLFYQFGVDVELYSHEHQYERFLPLFNGQVFNGTEQDPYHNPRAPVHVISGSAGCQERLDPFKGKGAPGSIKRIADYGFTRLLANKTHLHFEQISDDQNGTIVDEFTMFKDRLNFPPVDPTKVVYYTDEGAGNQ